MALLTFSLHYS